MLPEILYSMLIGGIAALNLFLLFYGIPKLIRFIIKKLRKK